MTCVLTSFVKLYVNSGHRGWPGSHHRPISHLLHTYLDHETMTRVSASRVEFYVGEWAADAEGDLGAATFRYLGFVTLSDNQGTAFQARELKSVTLQCSGRLLKLVLHRNHENELNTHQQASLYNRTLIHVSKVNQWNHLFQLTFVKAGKIIIWFSMLLLYTTWRNISIQELITYKVQEICIIHCFNIRFLYWKFIY